MQPYEINRKNAATIEIVGNAANIDIVLGKCVDKPFVGN